MHIHYFPIIILIAALFPGCASTRTIEQARATITELEQYNAERAARNIELEKLFAAERAGNNQLKEIIENQQSELDGYIESERNRIAAERLIIESLTGIFGEGSKIIEELINGYRKIKQYYFPVEILE